MGSSKRDAGWTLYVDESGKFDNAGEHILLTGVAIPSDDPFLNARLKGEIEAAEPLIPWPPHAWLVTKPTMYAVWREVRPKVEVRPGLDGPARELIRSHAETGTAATLFEAMCKAVSEGREPEFRDVMRFDSRLRKASRAAGDGLYDALSDYRDKAVARLRNVLRRQESAGVSSRAMGFVVSETQIGDAVKDDEDAEEGDRYLKALVALLERVRDVLGRGGAEHCVNLVFDRRKVDGAVLPGKRELDRAHIEWAADRANRVADESQLRQVRFQIDGVERYDQTVSAGLVLADLASNSTWRVTRTGWRGGRTTSELRGLQDWAATTLGLLFETSGDGEFELPHAAATGRARETINRARVSGAGDEGGLQKLPLDCEGRNWLREQANIWVRVLSDSE